ncbi:MAG: c-type cytochrome [Jhaorihella sp.]
MNLRIIGAVSGAAVAAVAGWYTLSALAPQQPGHDGGSIAPGAPIATVSVPESLSGDARIGKRAYDAKCAACHGPNAAGREGTAPPLVHQYYEPNHHGDAAFIRAARAGVRAHHWPFGDMPPVEGLTDADVKAITRYVRELQQANGIF